jgi:uncharacterized protein (DUF1501 family)
MNRRQLLQLALSAMTCTSHPQAFASQLPGQSNAGRRLILVELAGANDGLNTLVPYRNENYRRLRPTLSLPRRQTVALSDDFAMHESLTPLMSLWNQGQMAWLHGLGYPKPNRSHFKSIALWESGGDGHRQRRSGWLTHDIEHNLQRQVLDPHGISITEDLNLFASDSGRWLSMTSPEQFDSVSKSGAVRATPVNQSIAMVKDRMQALEASLTGLSAKLQQSTVSAPRLSGGELGYQLEQVVRLIRAGLDTPVYRVRLNGFDTHENQLYRHSSLLSQLATALEGFQQALVADGEWNNTIVATYSEFGRRVWENKSHGTDHGTAAPHFLLGGNINGGLYGSAPDINYLNAGEDPVFTLDYRALYTEILGSWFNMENNAFGQYRSDTIAGLIKS